MIDRNTHFFLLFLTLAAPALSVGWLNADVDSLAQDLNSWFKYLYLNQLDLSTVVGDIDDRVSNPRIFDFSTFRRVGDASWSGNATSAYVELTLSLSTLVLQAHLSEFILVGGLKVHLTDNAFTFGVRIFDDWGCTLQIEKCVARLDGMYVDVWGMTQSGDDHVKGIVRDKYNQYKGIMEQKFEELFPAMFNKLIKYADVPDYLCETFNVTVRT